MDPSIVVIAVAAVVLVAGVWWLIARKTPIEDLGVSEISGGLEKTASALGSALRGSFLGPRLAESLYTQMEEALLAVDTGVDAATEIVAGVRSRRPSAGPEARSALEAELLAGFSNRDRELRLQGSPSIVLVVGVNGSGKTTSIAKIAYRLVREGRSVLLGAADTFRAAGVEQLSVWGERLGVEVVTGEESADPAAVAFDAYSTARRRGVSVVIVDTAGRLHANRNLMAELTKVKSVLDRESGGVDEVLLVLDATAGQNGIQQVREYTKAVGVTGIVLAKLDGTARGGVVVAVERDLGAPVKLVGVGEKLGDLLPFEPDEFVEALLEET